MLQARAGQHRKFCPDLYKRGLWHCPVCAYYREASATGTVTIFRKQNCRRPDCLFLLTSFQTPVTIIRPFNTYGPRQSTRAIIPTIITQLARGERNLKLGALSPTRDFNFIDDTVTGFVNTLRADNINGETINLGSNYEISIGDTVKAIARAYGTDVTIHN